MLPWGVLVVALAAFWGGPAAAQPSGQPDSTAESTAGSGDDDGSQRVDESEENFRRRMELREQRFREQPRSNTTFSYSTSREGKLANLPPESQQHVREQLRDLVVESRLWEPGEDLTGYPYEPSAPAKQDAQLARQEREAFVEQLQKYQEREAAAAAADRAAGRAPTGEEGGGEAERRAERAGGVQMQGETGQGEGGPEPDAMSTAGVEESALEFLREQGLTAGTGSASATASPPGASLSAQDARPLVPALARDDADAEEAAPAAPPGTVELSALAQLDSTLSDSRSQSQSQARSQSQTESQSQSQSQAQSQAQPQSQSASQFQAASAQSADASAQSASSAERSESDVEITMRDVADPAPEPGTLDVESLQRLDLDALRTGLAGRPEPEDDEP